MENVFDTKGKLMVSIGESYLSAYEISVLKQGDIVKTTKLAGEGYSIFFNGHFLFTGEVVVINKSFGIRVTSFLPPKVGAEVPANSDDAIEMLPIMVRLGEIEVSLSELKGVGPGTIINLDTPYSEEEDAELHVAGIPVARGKVGVVYENMHLRITQLYGGRESTFPDLEVRSSGNLLEKDYSAKYNKDYNFKRPDKFSKTAIDKMKGIHDLFVRNLRLKYNLFENYELIGDQLTFGEFLEHAEVENYHYLLVQNRPWPRQIRAEYEAGKLLLAAPSSYYVEPKNAQYPATREQKDFIRKITTGDWREMLNGVFLCISKTGPLHQLTKEKKKQDFILSSLRGAWKNLVSMNFQLGKSTDNVDNIKVIHDNEMILLLTVRVQYKAAQEDLMYIVYPYLTLHPYVSILN